MERVVNVLVDANQEVDAAKKAGARKDARQALSKFKVVNALLLNVRGSQWSVVKRILATLSLKFNVREIVAANAEINAFLGLTAAKKWDVVKYQLDFENPEVY